MQCGLVWACFTASDIEISSVKMKEYYRYHDSPASTSSSYIDIKMKWQHYIYIWSPYVLLFISRLPFVSSFTHLWISFLSFVWN